MSAESWSRVVLAACVASGAVLVADQRPADVRFSVKMIDPGYSETAAVADLNRDGRLDIISGESWYAAPGWTRQTLRPINYQSGYIDNFSDLAMDVDADGWTDVVQFSYFAGNIVWLKNPGRSAGPWAVNEIAKDGPTEFGFAVDLANDGSPDDLLPEYDRATVPLAWFEHTGRGFTRHVIADRSFGHGIGTGDMNGDGRTDVLTPQGWLEAPASHDGVWAFHALDWNQHPIPASGSAPSAPASTPRGASFGFMSLLDLNGDSRPDMITGMAHDYGVAWYEQTPAGGWTQHVIDSTWSQAHAMAWADVNGDGQLDYITGKRYFAHNGSDPGEREPIGLYWYERRVTAATHVVEWIRHIVEYSGRMGGGMQIVPIDIDRDGDVDLVSGGKAGLFLAENLTR